MTEVQCGEVPTSPNDKGLVAPGPTKDHQPIRLYLPRVLRNAGLASAVSEGPRKRWQLGSLYKRFWRSQTGDPCADSIRAYYLLRHMAQAFDHLQLRPAAMSTILDSSCEMLQEHDYVDYHMETSGYKIWGRTRRKSAVGMRKMRGIL